MDIKELSNDILINLVQANKEAKEHIIKSKSKSKKVQYDLLTKKVANETIEEKESIEKMEGLIDTKKIKEIASALKDISTILKEIKEKEESGSSQSLADAIQESYKKRLGENDVDK